MPSFVDAVSVVDKSEELSVDEAAGGGGGGGGGAAFATLVEPSSPSDPLKSETKLASSLSLIEPSPSVSRAANNSANGSSSVFVLSVAEVSVDVVSVVAAASPSSAAAVVAVVEDDVSSVPVDVAADATSLCSDSSNSSIKLLRSPLPLPVKAASSATDDAVVSEVIDGVSELASVDDVALFSCARAVNWSKLLADDSMPLMDMI